MFSTLHYKMCVFDFFAHILGNIKKRNGSYNTDKKTMYFISISRQKSILFFELIRLKQIVKLKLDTESKSNF